jgi:hypothetical protein
MPTSMVQSGPLRFAKRLRGVGGAFQLDVEVALWIDISAETWVTVELGAAVGRCAGAAVLRMV